ncbi:unnamed protein product [Phaeothamnion confervicola]
MAAMHIQVLWREQVYRTRIHALVRHRWREERGPVTGVLVYRDLGDRSGRNNGGGGGSTRGGDDDGSSGGSSGGFGGGGSMSMRKPLLLDSERWDMEDTLLWTQKKIVVFAHRCRLKGIEAALLRHGVDGALLLTSIRSTLSCSVSPTPSRQRRIFMDLSEGVGMEECSSFSQRDD